MARSLSDVVDLLASAELTARGFLAGASNHTLLVRVGDTGSGLHAVYKPVRGERPLWDFPSGTLCRREVAAYVVSRFLGWDVVPPTVLRDGPFGTGSVQQFVLHDPELHYFVLVDDGRFAAPLARMAFFDLLINNADRKGSHVLLDEATGELVGIDHGVTFHAQPKLRTVIWDLGPAEVEESWRAAVGRLADELDTGGEVAVELAGLLATQELAALRERARALRRLRRLPEVPGDRRPYPWPPL
jgi:hypothetical protein